MPKVLLTGGGTAGHVTPNLALVPYLKEKGFEIEYMGSYDGIEKRLVEKEGIKYIGIDSGKLRRYMSVQNLKDPAHIMHGIREARKYMRENKPDVVFSKGGFVAVPVVLAARRYKIPIVIHESDLTPGLANRICIPRANRICYSFPETERYMRGKGIHTGLPIRDELFQGDAEKGREVCGFTADKPVLVVIGGSLGSLNVNKAVREALPELLKKYQIAHICGKGKMDASLNGTPGYVQFEYVSDGLNNLMDMADAFISRAGANVISEILALRKPSLLIPLGTDQSRGDQILNADSFRRRGFSKVLLEENLTTESLVESITEVYENREQYIAAMKAIGDDNAADRVSDIIASMVIVKVDPEGGEDVSGDELLNAQVEEELENEALEN